MVTVSQTEYVHNSDEAVVVMPIDQHFDLLTFILELLTFDLLRLGQAWYLTLYQKH